MQTMHIEIEEGAKAFRVNGVTIAKRHLVATLPKHDDTLDKKLARFLAIVPFLATSYTPADGASESIKYGTVKAKRLYKALGINEDNTMPFMLVCMQQAGADVSSINKELRESGIYETGEFKSPFQKGGQEETLFPRKPTLH